MSKINKIKITYGIVYGLGVLAILIFGLILTPINKASALTTPIYNSGHYNDNGSYTLPGFSWSDSTLIINTNNTLNNDIGLNKNQSNNKTEDKANNSLVASAIFGSSGIFPSGLIQWILLAIVILLIVILVRKISGGAERYHNEPLKHA